jgi:hypothetical protein
MRYYQKSITMNFIYKNIAFVSLLVLFVGCAGQERGEGPHPETRFQMLSSTQTGINFTNTLSERPTPHRTELLYEYFSNGGGVAIGDVNDDGLDDIYFTGNMSYNALYLNKGAMTFEEVTAAAGVAGRRNTWNTSVTMADVNGDGRLDLYVSYSGELPLDRRVDELYINQGSDDQGVPRFEEQAEAYGLSNPHSSNQAYFLDYDRDGDLDLFLQTHNVKTLPRRGRDATQALRRQDDPVNGNRFYVNNDGSFEDVTRQVGIESSPETYGLGAGISDINRDGWPDIYVGNDYYAPDYLYINNQDGTFINRLEASVGHISRSSMGVDVSDINNDGLSDIIVADMLPEENRRMKLMYLPNDRDAHEQDIQSGNYHQFTRNTLQLNNGDGTFSEIGQLAGVSNTDWSWAALAADFDNDGWKDMFVTNGILHDHTNQDFLRFKEAYSARRGYNLTPQDVGRLMSQMPSNELENYVFRNTGGVTYEDVTSRWNLDIPINSNGAAYADLDGDGDLDLVTNNINVEASLFENRSRDTNDNTYLSVALEGAAGNTFGFGAKVTLYTAETKQYLEQFPARGYLSSVSPVLHFGLGTHERVDSLHVVWPDGREQVVRDIEANQRLTLRQEAASDRPSPSHQRAPLFEKRTPPIAFRHRMQEGVDDFRRQPLMVNAKSFSGPALAQADVNGDGLVDVFVGGGASQASMLYLQQPDGQFVSRPQAAFEADRAGEDVDAAFVDVNGDAHYDLYVASGGYGYFSTSDPALQDRLYLNDGAGRFTKQEDALPQMYVSTGTVAAADINGDGLQDLFVGGRVVPGRYPEPPRSYVLINDGQGHFDDRTEDLAPELEVIGMVSDATWFDLDGTGNKELIVVGEWMPISVFRNDDGVLSNETDTYFDRPYHGLWNTVAVEDVTGDGRPDLIAGNLGLNSQLQASQEKPAELYYEDFDHNGAIEPILSFYMGDDRYPFIMLDRLRAHIPTIGTRFTSYEQYAESTLDEVLTRDEIRAAQRLEVDFLETALFSMNNTGVLERQPLPVEAQFSPVFSIEAMDYNDDGERDLLLTGNINEARIRFGKYDANYGVLLEGRGGKGFRYVPQYESGFSLRGDVRHTLQIGEMLLFGTNRDSLQAYRRAAR